MRDVWYYLKTSFVVEPETFLLASSKYILRKPPTMYKAASHTNGYPAQKADHVRLRNCGLKGLCLESTSQFHELSNILEAPTYTKTITITMNYKISQNEDISQSLSLLLDSSESSITYTKKYILVKNEKLHRFAPIISKGRHI